MNPKKKLTWFKNIRVVLFAGLILFAIGSCAHSGQSALPEPPLLFENLGSTKLIIFVHGINGNKKTTWTNKRINESEEFFWPEELAKDEKFKNADVLSYGYESKCGSSLNIWQLAEDLRHELAVVLEKRPKQSISFVAHSMGGLVVREFILSGQEKIIAPIKSVVLLATPNHGSAIAKFASNFCDSESLKHLTDEETGYIAKLNRDWVANYGAFVHAKGFEISAGYEKNPYLFGERVVDMPSATAYSGNYFGFEKNHLTIAKPINIHDRVYTWVHERLLLKDASPSSNSDNEEKQYSERIANVQKQLQETDDDIALRWVGEGQLDKALDFLSEKEGRAREEIAKIAKIRFAIANLYALKFDYPESLKYYEKTVQLVPDNAEYLNDTGLMLLTMGDVAKAIKYFERAKIISLKNKGPLHPDLAVSLDNLGSAWFSRRKYNKAFVYFKEALEINTKAFGQEDPRVAINLNNIGMSWGELEEFDKASEYFKKALEIDLKAFGPDHPEVAIDLNNLGEAWNRIEKYDEALKNFNRALEIDLKAFGPDHPRVAVYWGNLGAALDGKKEYRRAIDFAKMALESGLKTFGANHPKIATRHNNLGKIYEHSGDCNIARDYFEKALKFFENGGHIVNAKLVSKNINSLDCP